MMLRLTGGLGVSIEVYSRENDVKFSRLSLSQGGQGRRSITQETADSQYLQTPNESGQSRSNSPTERFRR